MNEALHRLMEEGAGSVTANAVEEAIGAESTPTMREIKVAAIDLERFDELYSVREVLQ